MQITHYSGSYDDSNVCRPNSVNMTKLTTAFCCVFVDYLSEVVRFTFKGNYNFSALQIIDDKRFLPLK